MTKEEEDTLRHEGSALPSLAVKSHTTPKSGLWLNTLLDVCALIIHSTQGFHTLWSSMLIDICFLMVSLNYYKIWVELSDCNVKLHPILGDLG
jgi:hypothetical protein